jgi:hypothetical protein
MEPVPKAFRTVVLAEGEVSNQRLLEQEAQKMKQEPKEWRQEREIIPSSKEIYTRRE